MNRALSGDTAEEYQLRVLVSDGGTPALTNTTLVRIRVNRNICQPRFDSNFRTYTFTIPETQSLGKLLCIDRWGEKLYVVWYILESQGVSIFIILPR